MSALDDFLPPDKSGQPSRAAALVRSFMEHVRAERVTVTLDRASWKRLRNEFKRPYKPEPNGGFSVYLPDGGGVIDFRCSEPEAEEPAAPPALEAVPETGWDWHPKRRNRGQAEAPERCMRCGGAHAATLSCKLFADFQADPPTDGAGPDDPAWCDRCRGIHPPVVSCGERVSA